MLLLGHVYIFGVFIIHVACMTVHVLRGYKRIYVLRRWRLRLTCSMISTHWDDSSSIESSAGKRASQRAEKLLGHRGCNANTSTLPRGCFEKTSSYRNPKGAPTSTCTLPSLLMLSPPA